MTFRRRTTIDLCSHLFNRVSPMGLIALVMGLAFKQISVFNYLFIFLRSASSRDSSFSARHVSQGGSAPTGAIICPTIIMNSRRAYLFRGFFFMATLYYNFVRNIPLIRTMTWLRFTGNVFPRAAFNGMTRTNNFTFLIFMRLNHRMFLHPTVSSRRTFTITTRLLFTFQRFPFLCFSIMLFNGRTGHVVVEGLLVLRGRIGDHAPFTTNGTFASVLY